MSLSRVVKKGDLVYMWGDDGVVDPTLYEVTGIKQSTIDLKTQHGVSRTMHRTRVAQIVVDKEVRKAMDENVMEQPMVESKPKAKPKAKAKTKPERVNFKGMIAEGWEIWSKPVKFPSSLPIKAEAHCAFAPDRTFYRVFNTYNGSMGKKADKRKHADGLQYPFKDEAAIDAKRTALAKKGYKKRKK